MDDEKQTNENSSSENNESFFAEPEQTNNQFDQQINSEENYSKDAFTSIESDNEEEFATEVAAVPNRTLNKAEDREIADSEIGEPEAARNRMWGYIGIALAIASLFFWPAVLGPGAAIIGFIALTQGNRALGIWSIVIGLISFMAYIVLVPLYT